MGTQAATAVTFRGSDVDPSSPQPAEALTELDPIVWGLLRQCAAELGVPLARVLETAAVQVLASWTRSTRTAERSSFLERAKRPREAGSAGDPGDVTIRVSTDGAETTFTVKCDLPRDVPGSRLLHWIAATPGALSLRMDAATEAFPPHMLDEMLEAEVFLLERLARERQAWHDPRLRCLPARALASREEANATDAPIPEQLLHRGFADQAANRPGQIAVAGAITLTYEQLRARAASVARRLKSLGASRQRPVAVVMHKGWQQVVSVLAILQAGSFYVPVDAHLPIDRIHFILENSHAELVVTQPGLEASLAWPACVRERVIVEDDAAPEPPADPMAAEPPSEVDPDELAYVIYTSGSTGVPKGVALSHRSAVNTVLDINRRFGVTASDRVLAVSSLSFDLSVYDIFGTLACGATIVIPDASNDPRHWASLMLEAGVTVWSSAPALMDLLVRELSCRQQPLAPSLRLVMLSGDWIPLGLPGQIRALGQRVSIVSLGGATEAGIWSIYYVVEKLDPRWRSIPYGKPLANQQLHVLADDLEPCPTWVAGHLYISGLGLAQGYWQDDVRTRKAFFVHPGTGVRLYRTGDMGRYVGSGDIEFLGREDTQVKVRGFRVELGEIERVILQHPSARECVALYRRTPTGGRITAYVVPTGLPTDELKVFLRSKLPDYMVPADLVWLDALPLTKNGKVDRDALSKTKQEPGSAETPLEQTAVARDEIEHRVKTIFERVLGRPNVGLREDFFALGGDSLLVVDLLHEIEKSFERTLPLAVVASAPTVERVSQVLRTNADLSASLVAILPGDGPRTVFCVHAGDGEVLCYRQLAPRLENTIVYGFETQRLRMGKRHHSSLDAMAAHYVAEMRALQPEGPYNLAGHSLGGTIALEMARRLVEDGQEVGMLALLDTNAIVCLPSTRRLRHHLQFLLWRARHHMKEMRALRPRGALRYIREGLASRAAAPAAWMRERLGWSTPTQVSTPREVCARAARHHEPRPYSGPVVVFRATELRDGPWESEPSMGWADYLTNVVFHPTSGGHLSMLTEPHVQTLARHLNDLLAPRADKTRPVIDAPTAGARTT